MHRITFFSSYIHVIYQNSSFHLCWSLAPTIYLWKIDGFGHLCIRQQMSHLDITAVHNPNSRGQLYHHSLGNVDLWPIVQPNFILDVWEWICRFLKTRLYHLLLSTSHFHCSIHCGIMKIVTFHTFHKNFLRSILKLMNKSNK